MHFTVDNLANLFRMCLVDKGFREKKDGIDRISSYFENRILNIRLELLLKSNKYIKSLDMRRAKVNYYPGFLDIWSDVRKPDIRFYAILYAGFGG